MLMCNGKPVLSSHNKAGFDQTYVIESLINGQFKQAKSLLLKGCKTRPEKLAFRVGALVGSLCDPESWNRPDLAERILNQFNPMD